MPIIIIIIIINNDYRLIAIALPLELPGAHTPHAYTIIHYIL